MKYYLEELKREDYKKWESFVRFNKNLTIFHTIKWKRLLEQTFNFESKYFIVKNLNGKIVGVSPAFKVKNFFKKVIISMPFFEYGGPFVKKGYEEAYMDIFRKYKEMVDNKEVKYVKIKSLPKDLNYPINDIYNKQIESSNFYLIVKKKNFKKDIWLKFTNRSNIRTSVKKAIKQGVVIKKNKDVSVIYDLIRLKDRKLGSPSFRKNLFINLKKELPFNFYSIICYKNKLPISGMLCLIFNDKLLISQVGSNVKYLNKCSTEILYVEALKMAIDEGLEVVDFGRSQPNSRYSKFKLKFGTNQRNIYVYYYPKNFIECKHKYSGFKMLFKQFPWIMNAKFGFWLRKNLI